MIYNQRQRKRGQLSLFVILGIILLIVIGVGVYLAGLGETSPLPVEPVPASLQPVKDHVEECLVQTAKSAFVLAGQQGGYVYPEEAGIVPIPGRETDSAALFFAPGSNITVPYWYYLSSSNTCTACQFRTQKPALRSTPLLPSVEDQVGRYVRRNLVSCLDFAEFERRQFVITSSGEPFVDVSIGENDVSLLLNYPLTVTLQDQTSELSRYQATLELDFKSIYEVATSITQEWAVDNYKALEHVTLQLITGYAIGDSVYDLPPIAGPQEVGFSTPKMWLLQDVKQSLQSLLTQHIPLVQVQNTRGYNLYTSDNQFSNAVYNNFVMPVTGVPEQDLNRISADFVYLPWWELYAKVYPNSGNLIVPEEAFSIDLLFVSFTSRQYDFSYDVAYPVVVVLKDEETLEGEGYTFQFGLETNIRGNEPLNSTPFDLERVGDTPSSLFANPNQRIANLTVTTVNALTGEPVSGPLISYHCGDDFVYLGEALLANGQAVLRSKLPQCAGGVLNAKLSGYVSEPYPLDVVRGESASIEMSLYPIMEKQLSVQKRMIQKEVVDEGVQRNTLWVFKNESSEDLALDDQVLVILERQSPLEDNFVRMASFSGSNEDNQTIELTVGEYKIEVILLHHFGENHTYDEWVIPEREECAGGGLFHGEECYTIPEIVFNSSLYLGGARLDVDTTGYFNITEEDLQQNTITMYAVAVNLEDLTRVEDLEQLGKPDEYVVSYKDRVVPVFS